MEPELYQFKITLSDSEPVVWRRFIVNNDATFHQLHGIIQIVMGWENYHMYVFAFKKQHIVMPEMDAYSFGEWSPFANEVCLHDYINRVKQKFIYIYDFGDDWQHEILFEKRLPVEKGIVYPNCLDGEYACPPEDSGGILVFDQSADNYTRQRFSAGRVNKKLRKLEW
jgi:hypothetical protein